MPGPDPHPQRMPAGFGPAYGPRHVPAEAPAPAGPERRTTVSFTVPVGAGDLAALVPNGLELRASTMTVQLQTLENLRWLAGRGYCIVSVTIPVQRIADGDAGEYLAVLWENMADPVITGRDELGFPKLFADLEVTPYRPDGSAVSANASWDSTPFFTADTGPLTIAAAPCDPPLPVVTRRYLPGLEVGAAPAVDHLTIIDRSSRPTVSVVSSAVGTGTFEFRAVTWQQLPTMHTVVNALAAIQPTGPADVQVTCVEGQFSDVRTVPWDGTTSAT